MEGVGILTIILIVLGALILLLAMFQTYRIFRYVNDSKLKQGWKNLFILMSFFFLGYFGVAYLVAIESYSLIEVLTGVIFFFGAVFVFIVSALGSKTFQMLRKVNNSLEDKIALLSTKNDQLTQFNYATSHDLREPINTVIGSIDMLKAECAAKLDEEGNMWIDYASKGANRMAELVSGLTEYINAGLGKNKKVVDIRKLVVGVIDEMNGSVKQTNAVINVGEMPALEVNKVELKRVFQNLIGNSIKYCKKDVVPEISITAEEDTGSGFWEFSIKDNGIGIGEREQSQVFQLFRQLNKKYDGMGVGLAITKKVVELHGGSIRLESQKGIGSTFTFTIKS